MKRDTPARDEIERVLRATHSRRRPRLAPDEDVLLHRALLESPWGRGHERFVLCRDPPGGVAGALRLGSLEGRLDGRAVRIARVGPPLLLPGADDVARGAELVARALEEARASGHEVALTLSGAGRPAGSPHAFRPLPCSEAACRTVLPAPWPKEPAWLRAGEEPVGRVAGLRPGGPDDLDALAEIHAHETAAQRLAIDRDRDAWEQILLARDLLHRAGGADDPFWVIETGGRVDAYVLLEDGEPTVRWREHGARDDASDRLEDLFWSALAWARRRGRKRIEGWFMPGMLTVLPLYPTSDRSRRNNVATLAGLAPAAPAPAFTREDECRLWELDAPW